MSSCDILVGTITRNSTIAGYSLEAQIMFNTHKWLNEFLYLVNQMMVNTALIDWFPCSYVCSTDRQNCSGLCVLRADLFQSFIYCDIFCCSWTTVLWSSLKFHEIPPAENELQNSSWTWRACRSIYVNACARSIIVKYVHGQLLEHSFWWLSVFFYFVVFIFLCLVGDVSMGMWRVNRTHRMSR